MARVLHKISLYLGEAAGFFSGIGLSTPLIKLIEGKGSPEAFTGHWPWVLLAGIFVALKVYLNQNQTERILAAEDQRTSTLRELEQMLEDVLAKDDPTHDLAALEERFKDARKTFKDTFLVQPESEELADDIKAYIEHKIGQYRSHWSDQAAIQQIVDDEKLSKPRLQQLEPEVAPV